MTALDTLIAAQGAIGWWPMQETSGTTVVAGIGSNGTYAGTHTSGCGPRSNLPVAAIMGTTSREAAVPLDLSATPRATITWWMWIDDWNGNPHIAVEHTANYNTNRGFLTYWDDHGLNETGMSSGTGAYRTAKHGVQPPAGTWHHWAATYDRSTSTVGLYLDGAAVTLTPLGTATMSGNFLNATLNIGARSGGAVHLRGKICGVAAFPAILTATQINDQIAAAGTVRPPSPSISFWNGTTEVPVSMSYWNGATETPIASIETL